MTNKPYAFIDAPVPEVQARKGVYLELLEDFVASGKRSVIVKMQDKSAQTVYASLKSALRSNRDRFADVRLVMRGGEVYLTRT